MFLRLGLRLSGGSLDSLHHVSIGVFKLLLALLDYGEVGAATVLGSGARVVVVVFSEGFGGHDWGCVATVGGCL